MFVFFAQPTGQYEMKTLKNGNITGDFLFGENSDLKMALIYPDKMNTTKMPSDIDFFLQNITFVALENT